MVPKRAIAFPKERWLKRLAFPKRGGWKGQLSQREVVGKDDFPKERWLERLPFPKEMFALKVQWSGLNHSFRDQLTLNG